MYHLSKDVRVNSSKHLDFHIKFTNISNDKNVSKFTLLCWIFSQVIFYKLNSRKLISKILMNYIAFVSQNTVFSVSALSTICQLNPI